MHQEGNTTSQTPMIIDLLHLCENCHKIVHHTTNIIFTYGAQLHVRHNACTRTCLHVFLAQGQTFQGPPS